VVVEGAGVVVVVVVDVVVVVSGEVGSGIDSGPSPGAQATVRRPVTTIAAIVFVVTVTTLRTMSHRARSAGVSLCESDRIDRFRSAVGLPAASGTESRPVDGPVVGRGRRVVSAP
jgi:hypothetical protein